MSPKSEHLNLEDCLAIARHWNQPFFLKEDNNNIFPTFLKFGLPNEEIDQLLATDDRLKANHEFVVRFRIICNLSRKFMDRPQKDDLKRLYKTRARKLNKLLDELINEVESYSQLEAAYFSDILQKQVNYMTEDTDNTVAPNVFQEFYKLAYTLKGVFHLREQAENSLCANDYPELDKEKILNDWEGSAEFYLKNFDGGHSEVKCRRFGVFALAETYLLSFQEMPTSSQNSLFCEAASLFYRYLGYSSENDASLYKDVKASISNLKKLSQNNRIEK
ncbi:MAG: hypothetical protein CMH29_11945 [Micavibrio sp.]|nr:hypothetical protein [Micavibrio sp.]|tara:strand:- start:207 stop:1034 length:828 start_codon:yes stop_codon:yes gene_type:complete